ncbi:CU044_2847 family protein [Nonomuraea sp. NPDC001636]|uniref:CU044_2847 family protein n=1 Tax=Nonomuraea sp. NPDC001636 TaxID=3154391 RepID=UPI0033329F3B
MEHMKVVRIEVDGEPVYIECVDVEVIGDTAAPPVEAGPSRLPRDPSRQEVGVRRNLTSDPAKLQNAWNEGMRSVRQAAGAAFKQLTAMPRKPDRMVIEVGVKMSAQAGLIMANVSGEASVKVTLEWSSVATAGAPEKEADDKPDEQRELAEVKVNDLAVNGAGEPEAGRDGE